MATKLQHREIKQAITVKNTRKESNYLEN